jgi:hypothetical protein
VVVCSSRRVVRPLVDALAGYLGHRHVRLPPERAPLKWTCMVCGDWRPDEAISVAHRELTHQLRGQPLPFNVRHCNDRAECVAYALAPGPWTGRPSVDA